MRLRLTDSTRPARSRSLLLPIATDEIPYGDRRSNSHESSGMRAVSSSVDHLVRLLIFVIPLVIG